MPPHSLLNHPQREHLAVLLAQMEHALDKLGALARPHASNSRLTVTEADLPRDFERRIDPIIQRIRDQIDTFVDRFGLRPGRVSRARTASALVTAELVRIEDSYSQNLRGYGPVAPDLAPVLDPMLQELHDGWLEIQRVLDDRGGR
jgi:hypothetical protein